MNDVQSKRKTTNFKDQGHRNLGTFLTLCRAKDTFTQIHFLHKNAIKTQLDIKVID
jgi:hypothetical protein